MKKLYCKIKGGEYKGWVGVVNSMVGDTSAQGEVWSVSITNDFENDSTTDSMTEVYLPESLIMFIGS